MEIKNVLESIKVLSELQHRRFLFKVHDKAGGKQARLFLILHAADLQSQFKFLSIWLTNLYPAASCVQKHH